MMLESLDEKDFKRILTEPENSIISQYQKLMAIDGISLEFSDEAIERIANKAIQLGIGARGLRTVLEQTMLDAMFYSKPDCKLKITEETVDSACSL